MQFFIAGGARAVRVRAIRRVAALVVLALAAATGYAGPALGQAAEPPVRFSIMDLGSFGLGGTHPFAINNRGQVAGQSLFALGVGSHAFRTAPNAPINWRTDDLGTLGGSYSYAYDINDLGQVVGESMGNGAVYAFRTAPDARINPATDNLTSAYGHGVATGINNLGQVVGHVSGGPGAMSFRTAPGGRVGPADDLGNLGTFVQATGVNNLGQAIGTAFNGQGTSPAFRTAPNAGINPATDDLGAAGMRFLIANDIDDRGEVVGALGQTGTLHAYRTRPNEPVRPADDLGTFGGPQSVAMGVNEDGWVVGYAEDRTGIHRAFLHDGSRLWNLNQMLDGSGQGWSLTWATAINDRGQIVGVGNYRGANAAFLLTPVPEPTAASLLTIAGAGLLRRRRRDARPCRRTAIHGPAARFRRLGVSATRATVPSRFNPRG